MSGEEVSQPAEQQARSQSEGERGPSQATVLRRLALERYDLGVSMDGDPYAVPASGPRIARPFRGGRTGLRAELAALYAGAHDGRVPTAGALADALTALEGEAQQATPRRLATRVAEHGGRLYLDLGAPDGQVVEVGADGWRVADAPPEVLFRRSALTEPVPAPVRGGVFDPLWNRVNVADEDRPLLLAWLVAALMPGIPHPVLALLGEQGCGKSTATRLLVELIDPSPAPLRSAPRDVEQWAVAAAASWVVGLDNVSGVPGWLSDTLCRAVTGDGMLRRRLYTDDGVSVLAFRRVIVTNGIDLGAVRGDLADRMVTLQLQRITADRRRTDGAVTMSDSERAQVLGAVLDLAADVLSLLPGVDLTEMPRMADYARVLDAVDKMLGTTGLARYIRHAADLAGAVLDSDPFASAVRDEFERLPAGDMWTGTGAELLRKLATPDPRPRSWPADAQRANGALRRVAPALREAGGLRVEECRDPSTRRTTWKIVRHTMKEFAEQASEASEASDPPLTSGNVRSLARSQASAGGGQASDPKPGEGWPKPGEGWPKPGISPGFGADTPPDLRVYRSAKPAKAPKPVHPANSSRCSCPNGRWGEHRPDCRQEVAR